MQATTSILLTALVFAVSFAAPAQVYKWKDAQGTVHYSDSPPENVHYERLRAPSSTGTPSAGQATGSGTTAEAAPPEPQRMADTPENRKKLCDQLKTNIDLLKSKGPVHVVGDDTADKLSQDRRSEERARAQKQYDSFCST